MISFVKKIRLKIFTLQFDSMRKFSNEYLGTECKHFFQMKYNKNMYNHVLSHAVLT